MRLALILSLTMLLLGCDQIQLRVGSSETETEIEIDSLKWEFTAGYNDREKNQGWLLNKETGELLFCTRIFDPASVDFQRECNPMDMRPAPDGYNVVPESPRPAEEAETPQVRGLSAEEEAELDAFMDSLRAGDNPPSEMSAEEGLEALRNYEPSNPNPRL